MATGPANVLVFRPSVRRESSRQAQLASIQSAKVLSDVVRTTLGPRAMLKMLLDPLGGITITNDGNSILREIDIVNPSIKSLIELSRSLSEEVGDGTTSCILLCAEVMHHCLPAIKANVHPIVVISGLMGAMEELERFLPTIATRVSAESDTERIRAIMETSLGTKFSGRFGGLVADLALEAVGGLRAAWGIAAHGAMAQDGSPNANTSAPAGPRAATRVIDIKRHVRVEKIPGGAIADCRVFSGVVIAKDVTHSRMARRVLSPRVLVLDCTLEYKKGESQTIVDVNNEASWAELLRQEEEEIRSMCEHIISSGCDVLITEKGISDLAQHFLARANVSCLRRVRKSDAARVALACGATVVSRPEEICPTDVGQCTEFYVQKIGRHQLHSGDEYYSFFACERPRAVSVLLRGASRDVLNEVERNLTDALYIARNILADGLLLPGGGAAEAAASCFLARSAKSCTGSSRMGSEILSKALLAIPRVLAQNAGANPSRIISFLARAIADLVAKWQNCAQFAQAAPQGRDEAGCPPPQWGIDGDTGQVVDVTKLHLFDPHAVKLQVYKSAVEIACVLLRIDTVVSGIRKAEDSVDDRLRANEPASGNAPE